MKKTKRQILCLILAGLMLLGVAPVSAQEASAEIKSAEEYAPYSEWSAGAEENKGGQIVLTADDIVSTSGDVEILDNYKEMNGKSISTGENSAVTFRVNGASGWYTLKLTYYLEECRSGAARLYSIY